MASIQKRKDSFRVLFVYHGKLHSLTLGPVSDEEAQAKAHQVDYLLLRLKQGLIRLPPLTDIVTFVKHDGKVPEATLPGGPSDREPVTLAQLRDRYLATHQEGVLEETTLEGMHIHFRHLVATFGERFPVGAVSLADLQGHTDRRARMKGLNGKLSSATIKKELVTLRTIWNWGAGMGLFSGKFPALKQVRMAKPDEKPPFQTREEIERRLRSGGLNKKETDALWDCLYLTRGEIDELLGYVKEAAIQPWVYPLFCFAAHTGARRSELVRVLTADVDLEGMTALLREKKRAHDRRTTRRVPLTPFLAGVIKGWLGEHPGGPALFSQGTRVARSKSKRPQPTPVTTDEAHDHFKRTLRHSQ